MLLRNEPTRSAFEVSGWKQVWARAETSIAEGAFAITSKAKNPEILIRWIDHCNQEEYTPQMAFGMFKPEGIMNRALVPSKNCLEI